MFTVKHITVGGSEVLYQATDVGCYKCRGPDEAERGDPWRQVVTLSNVGVAPTNIHDGTVFVMNAAGATVSRWDLGASPLPTARPSAREFVERALHKASEPPHNPSAG